MITGLASTLRLGSVFLLTAGLVACGGDGKDDGAPLSPQSAYNVLTAGNGRSCTTADGGQHFTFDNEGSLFVTGRGAHMHLRGETQALLSDNGFMPSASRRVHLKVKPDGRSFELQHIMQRLNGGEPQGDAVVTTASCSPQGMDRQIPAQTAVRHFSGMRCERMGEEMKLDFSGSTVRISYGNYQQSSGSSADLFERRGVALPNKSLIRANGFALDRARGQYIDIDFERGGHTRRFACSQ